LNNTKKIRILNIITCISDGGLEKIIYKIYCGLDKEKYILDICTLKKLEDNFNTENFRNVSSNLYSLAFKNKNLTIKDHYQNFKQVFNLVKLIISNEYDIIHSHEFFAAFYSRIAVIICRILLKKKPLRVFITYHTLFNYFKPIHHFTNRLLSYFTDKIVCVSESVEKYTIEKEKIRKNKLLVIFNGLNPNEFYPDNLSGKKLRASLGFTSDNFILGNVGVHSVSKGKMYLLEAFNVLSEKYENLRLVLAGSTREHELNYYNEIIKYIEKNKLGEKILLLNTAKEINGVYNMFDVFVMSSIREGFGLAAYEAMLAEKLCVFSDISTFKEFIIEGDNGFIFENKNSRSLIKILDYIILNINKLDYIKVNGREFVKNKFSEEEMINKYKILYTTFN
jgi:glycosyltransferase involved in cell wall biosynthesis